MRHGLFLRGYLTRSLSVIFLGTVLVSCAPPSNLPSSAKPVSWSELQALPLPRADQVVAYGLATQQTIDVRLPKEAGSHPVMLLLHGGCWSNGFDAAYLGHWAEALRQHGWATFNVEYRRVGDPGGGWPGTMDDITSATAYVLSHAAEWKLDVGRVVVVGHSAGGQLALLLAAQEPRITAVVGLAAITDLAAYQKEPIGCAEGARAFVRAEDLPTADAMQRALPSRARIFLWSGSADAIVPPRYAEKFAARSSAITLTVWPGAGHFDLVSPTSTVWPEILKQISTLK